MIALLYIIFFAAIISAVYQILRDMFYMYIAPKFKGALYIDRQQGSWAIVTGAGDGIGKAFCISLARRKINVCLIGRTLNKLEKVANDLKIEYGVETLVIKHDFGVKSTSSADSLKKKLGPILPRTSVLINNVGTATLDKNDNIFWEVKGKNHFDLDTARNLVSVNIDAALLMTSILLPHMESKKTGAIVFLSSICSLYPMAGIGVYCGTKSFITHFAHTLRQDVKKDNIHVLTYAPFFVKTKLIPRLFSMKVPEMFVPRPEVCAEQVLKLIGVQTYTFGFISHVIINHILNGCFMTCPTRLVDFFCYQGREIARKQEVELTKQEDTPSHKFSMF